MKKKLLAVGVAAALSSGVASAAMQVNDNGIGHINVLPYYSVQAGNATLLSITNTDTSRGKAVKVRFRGAKTSDDVFDFQVFLSPGDVWTGAVTLDGTTAKMTTTDKSCTLPQSVNQSFVTARLLDAEKATGSLEGYVEIINMGDITTTTDTANSSGTPTGLFKATKHVAGVAPCTSAVLIGTGSQPVDLTTQLSAPTSGLTSFATIINVPASKAFTVVGTALSPNDAGPALPLYWRQANILRTYNADESYDRIFNTSTSSTGEGAGGNVTMYEFDLPDLSTPYSASAQAAAVGAKARTQRNEVTSALAIGAVMTEYISDAAILASTDVVMSQPTRRYYYTWFDTPNAAAGDTLKTLATLAGADGTYDSLSVADNSVAVNGASFTDREEQVITSTQGVVISPNPLPGAAATTIKGEVAVIGINNGAGATGALGAALTAQTYDFAYNAGWALLSTTTANAGTSTTDPDFPTGAPAGQKLPVVGFTAINVFNGGAGAAGTNYGMTLEQRYIP